MLIILRLLRFNGLANYMIWFYYFDSIFSYWWLKRACTLMTRFKRLVNSLKNLCCITWKRALFCLNLLQFRLKFLHRASIFFYAFCLNERIITVLEILSSSREYRVLINSIYAIKLPLLKWICLTKRFCLAQTFVNLL